MGLPILILWEVHLPTNRKIVIASVFVARVLQVSHLRYTAVSLTFSVV